MDRSAKIMKKLYFLIIFNFMLVIIPSTGYGRFDISTDASYSKQVYGDNKVNALRTRSYGGSFAYYFYYLTAFEVNYIYDQTTNSEVINYKVTETDYTLKSAESELISEVISVGLRQAFSRPEARIRPTVSLGYAYRMYRDKRSYHYKNDINGSDIFLNDKGPLSKQNSFFSAFGIQLRLIGQFYLRGSVQTVFAFFRPSLASDYLKYSAGFLCSF
ncbi:MAG: hypothetical protein A2202_04835 [Bdellovibrionales bacterium RIFOXYA1_FULL_36_14]|nr:MAG: hypothetical protein A2202_04835 [Bdellovibrionales bacterium RIFOXYA1_FULL_36_14]